MPELLRDETVCSSPNGINRRQLLQMGLGATIVGITNRMAAGFPPNFDRPNIVFLMADQHRGDCVGAAGNSKIETPNLDRLATEGAIFRQAYSSTPSCTPARAAILTGLAPWNHGMLGYGQIARQYKYEMPRTLADNGYYAICIGKNHYYPQRERHGFHLTILDEDETPTFRSDYSSWFHSEMPFWNSSTEPSLASGLGWNDYAARAWPFEERLHPTHWTGETAVKFIRTYDQRSPFFLKVSFMRPHSPYDPPVRWMRRYEHVEVPRPAIGRWAEGNAQRGTPYPTDLWKGDVGIDQTIRSRQGYYGSVSFVDEQVGRILEALEQRGILDNTLVLYTADHGDMIGDHYLWRKCYPYDGSARVPMIIRWPDSLASVRRGLIFDSPVELRDIFPTFADAAKVAASSYHCDGKSLLHFLSNGSESWRPFIDLEHDICYSPTNHWSALTDGLFKYIFCALDGREQLFDLKNDPGETDDLVADQRYQPHLNGWRQRLIEHLSVRGDEFVANGMLVKRPKSHLYSPNYPGTIVGSKEWDQGETTVGGVTA